MNSSERLNASHIIVRKSFLRPFRSHCFLSPAVGSSQLMDVPRGCGGPVRDGPGVRGGCGCDACWLGGSPDWPCALEPRVKSFSFGLGYC